MAVVNETAGVVDASGGVTINSKDGTLKTQAARYLIKSKDYISRIRGDDERHDEYNRHRTYCRYREGHG